MRKNRRAINQYLPVSALNDSSSNRAGARPWPSIYAPTNQSGVFAVIKHLMQTADGRKLV
jgi:hypothetical protein